MTWDSSHNSVHAPLHALRYDRESGEWTMEKAPVYHIID
jgi:hypothetical protein